MGGITGPATAATSAEATAVATPASQPLVGTTMHANLVTIYPADDTSSQYDGLSFTPSGSYSITSGQPWGGVSGGVGAFDGLRSTTSRPAATTRPARRSSSPTMPRS